MDVGSFRAPPPPSPRDPAPKAGPPPQLTGTAPLSTNPWVTDPLSSPACREKASPQEQPTRPQKRLLSQPSASHHPCCPLTWPEELTWPQPSATTAAKSRDPAPTKSTSALSRLVSTLVRHSTAPPAGQSNIAWGQESGRKTLRQAAPPY